MVCISDFGKLNSTNDDVNLSKWLTFLTIAFDRFSFIMSMVCEGWVNLRLLAAEFACGNSAAVILISGDFYELYISFDY